MGRGGEGVGGNWRGVALTHQATLYKNKTSGHGNGTVLFLYISSTYRMGRGNNTKTTYVSSLTSVSLSYLSLIQVSFFCISLF